MNSSTPPTRGFEIFYLSDKGAEENMQPKLLETELSGTTLQSEKDVSQKIPNLVRHIMLEKILIILKQRETLNSSAHLAHAISRNFKTIKGSKSRGVHRQEYVVLKNVKTHRKNIFSFFGIHFTYNFTNWIIVNQQSWFLF